LRARRQSYCVRGRRPGGAKGIGDLQRPQRPRRRPQRRDGAGLGVGHRPHPVRRDGDADGIASAASDLGGRRPFVATRRDAMSGLDRGGLLRAGAAAGVGATIGVRAVPVRVGAQEVLMTASGAGVNLKMMPNPDGEPVVPMRESFAFDAVYAQCIVEDNPTRFAMDTFCMRRVVIEPHQFFMAMYADAVGIDSIRRNADGSLTATMLGSLFCATFAGTSSVTVGGRDAKEHARFKIEATDGGVGGNAPPDKFAFTVYFDEKEAPVNHGIFGPEFTFTGEMIAGKITIGPPITGPLSADAG